MTWATSAQALLDAAATATLTKPADRKVVAPGPLFARDCRMLAVYLDSIDTAPLDAGELPGGQSCIRVPVLSLALVFVADCVPVPNDAGKPPPAADVTTWSAAFLADCEAVFNAVADAADGGALGDCSGVSISPGTELDGPLGRVAEVTITVRLLGA